MRTLSFALMVATLAACDATSEPTVTDSAAAIGDSGEGLRIVVSERAVSGTFTLEGDVVAFEAAEVGDELYDVTVEVHGMILDAVVDTATGVASVDGFAAVDGTDTQMLDEDRELVHAFYRALSTELGEEVPEAAVVLRHKVGGWAEHPSTAPLASFVAGEEGRTIESLCGYVKCRYDGGNEGSCDYWNWYTTATHDDWDYDRGEPPVTQNAQLGNHFACAGDEYYWTGATWACGEPDHWSGPYVVGNCFGRSGPDCGSDYQYTKDPTDHDGCVRNGHSLASLWCDDEFASASDDELFAADCY